MPDMDAFQLAGCLGTAIESPPSFLPGQEHPMQLANHLGTAIGVLPFYQLVSKFGHCQTGATTSAAFGV